VLQVLKVGKFPPYIDQLLFQAAAHWRTGLQAIPSQIQEAADLAELESKALYAAYKGERLDVVLAVLTEAALCSGRAWHQGVALVETNGINTEADFLRDYTNLHRLGSSSEGTPWSIVQSQVLISSSAEERAGER